MFWAAFTVIIALIIAFFIQYLLVVWIKSTGKKQNFK